ncbi:MAG: A24 family peptidase [bacterium]
MALSDILLILLLVISLTTDLITHKIYNCVTFPAVAVGLLLSVWNHGISGLTSSMLGLAIGFSIFAVVFAFGGVGGGDVKLMAAVGAIGGYPFILNACFYGILAGGILAIAVMIWKGTFWRGLKNIFRLILSFIMPGLKTEALKLSNSEKIPYGAALSVGVFIAWVFR